MICTSSVLVADEMTLHSERNYCILESNGKYSNTTYISKIWPESKKPRFSRKTPESQKKQKNPRSREKKQQWQHWKTSRL